MQSSITKIFLYVVTLLLIVGLFSCSSRREKTMNNEKEVENDIQNIEIINNVNEIYRPIITNIYNYDINNSKIYHTTINDIRNNTAIFNITNNYNNTYNIFYNKSTTYNTITTAIAIQIIDIQPRPKGRDRRGESNNNVTVREGDWILINNVTIGNITVNQIKAQVTDKGSYGLTICEQTLIEINTLIDSYNPDNDIIKYEQQQQTTENENEKKDSRKKRPQPKQTKEDTDSNGGFPIIAIIIGIIFLVGLFVVIGWFFGD